MRGPAWVLSRLVGHKKGRKKSQLMPKGRLQRAARAGTIDKLIDDGFCLEVAGRIYLTSFVSKEAFVSTTGKIVNRGKA